MADALGVAGMTARVLAAALAGATGVAAAIGFAASWRLGAATVRVGLDASRRWVTLANVDPAFARALRADQASQRETTRQAITDQPRNA